MKIPEIMILQSGVWSNPMRYRETPTRFVLTYEIEYHRIGYGDTTINGERYPIRENTLTFNRPADIRNSDFNIRLEANTEFVYFAAGADGGDAELEYLLSNIPNHTVADERLGLLWNEMFCSLKNGGDPLCEMRGYLHLLSLLTYLSQQGRAEKKTGALPSSNQRVLFEAIRYMREHVTERLCVDAIAFHIGYSRSHFNHLFKAYTNHTPHSYFLSLKIDEAKYLLLKTDKTVAQIAEELAFGKVSRFGAAFKRECLMTPGEFRKKRNAVLYNG